MKPLTGQCLCGGIQYEVDKLEPQMGHCHCKMCRKFHGAAFSTYGEAKRENFRWVRGEELLTDFIADNGTKRQFCRKCGSSLTFAVANDTGAFIEFTLGTLDSEINERPDAHIYTDFKADWAAIEGDLPCYTEGRDSKLSIK